MCVLPSAPGRLGLDAPGFTMSARRDAATGKIDSMHAQDPRHNLGKLYAHLDSAVRYLEFGNARATHEHVRAAFETFDVSELGLSWSAVQRDDRMDKAGPACCAGRRVRRCLAKLVAGHAGDAKLKPGMSITRPEPTMQGTIDYLDMCSRYLKVNLHLGCIIPSLPRDPRSLPHASNPATITPSFEHALNAMSDDVEVPAWHGSADLSPLLLPPHVLPTRRSSIYRSRVIST